MPLWRIYHPEDFFSEDEQSQIANSITELYTGFLPAFYVDILFIPLAHTNIYVGGKPRNNFVRFAGEHTARKYDGDKARMIAMMKRFNAVVTPFMKAKDADWEAHIAETPFELWTINGMQPPPPGSEQEVSWKAHERPVRPCSIIVSESLANDQCRSNMNHDR